MFIKVHVFQGPGFSVPRFFRVQVFRVWIQGLSPGSGSGSGVRVQGPGSGSRFRVQVIEEAAPGAVTAFQKVSQIDLGSRVCP